MLFPWASKMGYDSVVDAEQQTAMSSSINKGNRHHLCVAIGNGRMDNNSNALNLKHCDVKRQYCHFQHSALPKYSASQTAQRRTIGFRSSAVLLTGVRPGVIQ